MKPSNKLMLGLCILTTVVFSSLLAETPSNEKTTPQEESDVLTAQLLKNDDFEERFEEAVEICSNRNKLRDAVGQAHLEWSMGRTSAEYADHILMLYRDSVKLCADKREELRNMRSPK